MAEEELQAALARISGLEAENERLQRAVKQAAGYLRSDLTIRSLNDAIREINSVLPREDRIDEVCWGVATLSALQEAVGKLATIVSMPERAAFLIRQSQKTLAAGQVGPFKRQPLGGIR